MTTVEALNRGRDSYSRQDWLGAFTQLSAADAASPLGGEDLERLAVAAHLAGKDSDSTDLLTRAHATYVKEGNAARAARCGFWIGFRLVDKGEMARAGGWLARAQRLLDDSRQDCVERGYLLLPLGLQRVIEGYFSDAYDTFGQAVSIGERFSDPDLVTFARHGQGRALIMLGETVRGVGLLDEVMVAVTAGEVSPLVAGIVYCSVIEACGDIFDIRRAQEWTSALTDWCDAQNGLVPYRGACRLRRAEIMQLRGDWQDAMEECLLALEQLSLPPGDPAAGTAAYQQAELFRLRGEFSKAEDVYRQASQLGKRPEPGLALLRLAQGQVDTAEATIRRVLDEAGDRITRSRLLGAYVEIMIAVDDLAAARAAADELSEIATVFNAPLLHAAAAQAHGAVMFAEGDLRAALTHLRSAWSGWQELGAQYEAARARVLVGQCCRALGDEDSAEMEFDAALSVFSRLAAAPGVAQVESLSRRERAGGAGGLTAREMEVLRLVAAGKTNRAVAAELVISEKTVARHISNIFAKLDISSRSAATAYAYEHSLL